MEGYLDQACLRYARNISVSVGRVQGTFSLQAFPHQMEFAFAKVQWSALHRCLSGLTLAGSSQASVSGLHIVTLYSWNVCVLPSNVSSVEFAIYLLLGLLHDGRL